MKYGKPPLTFEKQCELLQNRGMIVDPALVVPRLQSVNYFRLSGYWYPYRAQDPKNSGTLLDSFKADTNFTDVWNRYVFDRRLRLLVLDAVERIEIATRASIAYHHAHNHGPFGYATDATSLPKLSPTGWKEFVERIEEETGWSKEAFVTHFKTKYGADHNYLPVWMATEIMTFGTILTFFRGASHTVKQSVASVFGMPDKVFDSWLLTLNTVRNICAHHSRLWNRELGVKPIIPRIAQYPAWHTPVKVENKRMFAVLTICQYSLRRIAPQSGWLNRLQQLLADFPNVPTASMGFPANWTACPIWAPPGA